MDATRATQDATREIAARGSAIAHLLGIEAAQLLASVERLLARGFTICAALDRLVLDWPD